MSRRPIAIDGDYPLVVGWGINFAKWGLCTKIFAVMGIFFEYPCLADN